MEYTMSDFEDEYGQMDEKFIVLKKDDIQKYLKEKDQGFLADIMMSIAITRQAIGKNPMNKYLVINVDEPYIGEIIEIMKRHGHWG